MSNWIKRFALFGLLWLIYFGFARFLFYLVVEGIGAFDAQIFLTSWRYGLKLDLSIVGYLLIIWGLYMLMLFAINAKHTDRHIHRLTALISTVFSAFIGIDFALFRHWDSHIDSSILEFLRTPAEAMASTSWADTGVTVLVASFLMLFSWIVQRIAARKWPIEHINLRSIPLLVFLIAASIIPMRGGIGIVPIGVSSAFHSNDNFRNQLAINPVWNAMISLVEHEESDLYQKLPKGYKSWERVQTSRYENPFEFKTSQPNVVVIILESFTANVIGSIGGIDGPTPQLNKWAEKSIVFDHFYSNGDRSDRGLTTLFTGYPAIPNHRLLQYPTKLARATNLFQVLNEAGYQTSCYYGGNFEFAGMNMLFTLSNVDRVVESRVLDSELPRGKWGVHDGPLFEKFYNDIRSEKQPFAATIYTLSSHEPYDIPDVSYQSHRKGQRFYEAVYYTDSCVGQFLDSMSKSPMWENTLVVITADHGSRKPDQVVLYSPRKFRIPLMITGGVVKEAKRLSHYGSHQDLPFSMLQWLNLPSKAIPYGKQLLDTTQSYAPYYYNYGAGIINEEGCLVYDLHRSYFLYNSSKSDSSFQSLKSLLFGTTKHGIEMFRSY